MAKDIFVDLLSCFTCFTVVSAEGKCIVLALYFIEVCSDMLQFTVDLGLSDWIFTGTHSY
jgi:hypothetical protein